MSGPLQGLKVERFGFGKRGMIALTNQNLTVPLPHHLLNPVHLEHHP